MSSIPSRRIVLLAYDEMNLLDLTGPLQALATASRYAVGRGMPAYEIVVASGPGGLITTSSGLAVMTVATATLDAMAIDTLIAPGGCKGDTYHAPPALVAWIASRAPQVRRLCSVCTGAFLLAAAGQLDGRRVATHWEWTERLGARHPGIDIDPDSIYVRDGAVWTSAGVSAGIDLALALIEEDFGPQIAIDTARQLVVFLKRPGGQSQFSVPLVAQSHAGRFADLHAWMATHLADDLRVERLAERVGMSPRSFARHYADAVGCTPARTVDAMRLEAARRALEDTDWPLKRIAAEAGYHDEQALRRAFQRQLAVGPAEYRARFSRGSGPPMRDAGARLDAAMRADGIG